MFLSGAADAESVDQGLIDRLEAVQKSPLRLNRDSRTRLLSGGLITQYQIATLNDYRASSGDVLSLSELALIDGFGAEWVEVMAPFISLESSLRPGEKDSLVWRHNLLTNTDLKAVRGKYRLNVGNLTAGVAGRLNYEGLAARKDGQALGKGNDGQASGKELGAYTFYLEYCLPRWRIIAGDFNTRFGQGLAMWTGFRLGGLQTVEAFMLHPGGIVPSWSVSGEGVQRGVALQWTPGNWQISAFGSLGGDGSISEGSFGLHAGRWFLKGECGAGIFRTPQGWKANIEGRWHIGRATLFGEGAAKIGTGAVLGGEGGVLGGEGAAKILGQGLGADEGTGTDEGRSSLAGLIGCRIGLFESDKLALQLRAVPSRFSGKKNGEYAFAAGYQWKQASLTGEFSLLPVPGKDSGRMQVKSYGLWTIPFGGGWSLGLRAYERWRNYERNRLDLRGDLSWENGIWTVRGRMNAVLCSSYGLLGFIEGGYKNESWTVWLRGEVFRIDNWDDRIYVYEHDAPGNFTVPACYGRGGAVSVYAGWKKRLGSGRKGVSGKALGGNGPGDTKWPGDGGKGVGGKAQRPMTLRCYLRAYGMARYSKPFSPALRVQIQLEF